jgi:hypothetical protein
MQVLINPVILSYIPLIILPILLGIALDVILLWRGRWETGTRLAKIGTNLFGLYVLFVLVSGHNAWLAQEGVGGFLTFLEVLPEGAISSQGSVLVISMHAFRLAFSIAFIVVSVDTIKMVYQLLKRLIARPVTFDLPGGKA